MRKTTVHYTEALDDSVVLEVFNPEGEIKGFPLSQLDNNKLHR